MLSKNWFVENISNKVGARNIILFWKNRWLGCIPLRFSFQKLFQVCTNKDVVLADVRAWVDGSWEWNFNSVTSFDIDEVAEKSAKLVEILKGILLTLDFADVLRWRNSIDSDFFVKSCYIKLKLWLRKTNVNKRL